MDACPTIRRPSLVASRRSGRLARVLSAAGHALLFLVASSSAFIVLFIFYFIIRDAIPFFRLRGFAEFFTGTEWHPSTTPPAFGALPMFYGSGLVTLGAVCVAVPVGVVAAVCLSDILPFWLRQVIKPVIELLAAIPSVAFGFFALVVLAPQLQAHGGRILATAAWLIGLPLAVLAAVIVGDLAAGVAGSRARGLVRALAAPAVLLLAIAVLRQVAGRLAGLEIASGTNALNVSIILGIMALPTVVSVSEDALQAVGRELREGAYALGATRAETVLRVVIPAAASGICAAVILGIMRAVGETMVVWMASGNAAQIPTPWWDFLQPVRTLTATIAGEMGEADHTTASARYSVLFAMALCLLTVSYIFNLISERIVRRGSRGSGLQRARRFAKTG